MKKLFQYIRRQPKSVRDNYALAFAGLFTSIVLMFWLVSRPEAAVYLAEDKNSPTEKQVPFASLIQQTKAQLATLKKDNSSIVPEGEDQTAATLNSTNTSASNLVLTPENINAAQEVLEETNNITSTNNSIKYQEVLIATTSSTKIEENKVIPAAGTATTTSE